MSGTQGWRRRADCFADNVERSLHAGLIEPGRLFICQRPFGGQLRIVVNLPRLVRSYALLHFEAFDLARGGSRQIFLPDLIATDAFGGSDLLRQAFDVVPDNFFGVHNLLLAQHIEVGHDHRVQTVAAFPWFTFQSHHRQFFDVGRLQVVSLDLFGINILPVAEHDHFFFAASEEQVPARIKVAEIAGIEPPVAQHRRGRVRSIPVAFHHNLAA